MLTSWKLPLARLFAFGAVTATLASAGGCVVVVDDPVGTMQMQWSLNGSFDPAGCTARGLSEAVLTVTGPKTGTYRAPCSGMATKISDLPAGTYSVSVVMYTGANPRTTAASKNFTITGSATTTLDFEFPDSSFLP